MMDTSTQQFVSRLFACILAAVVVGIAGALIGAIFVFGDGEAQHIISDLTPPFLALLAAFAAVYTGHTVTTALLTSRANTNATPSIPTGYALIAIQTPPEVARKAAPMSAANDSANVVSAPLSPAQGHSSTASMEVAANGH